MKSTSPVRLVHPARPGDERTVTRAVAAIHKRAGWIDAAKAEQIPDAAKDVASWIGHDPDKAAVALIAEQARATPRKTVLDHIETVTAPDPDPTPTVTPDESQED